MPTKSYSLLGGVSYPDVLIVDPVTKQALDFSNLSNGAITSVPSMAALKAVDTSKLVSGNVVEMSSYYGLPTTRADAGAGRFVWNASATGAGNDGTFVAPTANPTTGRFIRLDVQDEYLVDWYGAIGDGNTANATINGIAIDAAIADANANKRSALAINKVVFMAGGYYTDRNHRCDRTAVAFKGAGALNSRVIAASSLNGPVLHLFGGFRATAAPYGGLEGISFYGNTGTFPSIVYIDDMIDNMFKMNDLGFTGGGAGCDGLSFFDYLNAHCNTLRGDSNSGYLVRIRGVSSLWAGASGLTAGHYWRNPTMTNLTTTGVWQWSIADPSMIKGSGAALFTTGVLPTDPVTGVPLKGGSASAGAGLYFVGPWNSATYSTTLHRTQADAIAGINPIIPTDTGSGTHSFCVIPCICPISAVDTATDSLTYSNRVHTMIPTSTFDPASNASIPTLGSGFTGTGTLTWDKGASRIGILYGDGTPPTGLTYGVPVYFIYSAFNKVKIATTLANAVAGIAVDLTDTGTGNMWIAYHHNVSTGGIGSFEINQVTYDNAGAATVETVNGVASGGYGLCFYAQNTLTKGVITISGHRIEINKLPARDLVFGDGMRAMIRGFASQSNNASYFAPSTLFNVENMQFDLSASLIAYNKSLLGIACNANVDIAPTMRNCLFFGFGAAYNNESGNAFSAIGSNGSRSYIEHANGWLEDKVQGKKLSGSQYNMFGGINHQRISASNLATSYFKTGDLCHSDDTGTAFYKAVGASSRGVGIGTGSTSIGATVTGTVAAGNVFTLSATPTDTNFCTGSAVSIAGAGAAGAALTGIVGVVDIVSAVKTFTLHSATNGSAVPCLTDVTAVACTYQAQPTASVPVQYRGSGTVNPGAIVATGQVDVDIAAPAGVTLPSGAEVSIGLSGNPTAGIAYVNPRVKSGGAFVTVTVINYNNISSVTPSSMTVKYSVLG